jgi:DNA ligase-4
LIDRTALGVRAVHKQDTTPVEKSVFSPRFYYWVDIFLRSYSQASLMTDTSDDRHLGLVFFDILMLNSTSLLHVPYSSRRGILESVIKPIPNRVILADRKPVSLSTTPNDRNPRLHRIFAQCLARPEEGLVLKAGEAGYNDRRLPWVKLKRDYIPGYGDCVDLVVLGASWDKDRGRELRGKPLSKSICNFRS